MSVAESVVEPKDVARLEHADGTIDYVDIAAIGGDVEDMPKGYFRSLPFLGTVVAQCFASIVAYLGWVLPANTLSIINADLGGSANISWVAFVWTLGSCIGFLIVGRMSDIFGRKWMVQGTTLLSLIGCIICACAVSVNMLIAGNLLNGISAAGQLSFGIVLGELVPNKYRGPIVTIVFLSSLPFAVFGPIIARLLINNTKPGWRWSFYLGIIFNVLTGALYFFFYHPPSYDQLHVHGKTKWQMFKELDFIGIFLFIAGCVLFLIGLSWGGTSYPWASAGTLCPLLIGVATLAGFVVYEGYFCKVQPFMPPRLFRNIEFTAIVVIAVVGAMVYYSMTVLWPTIISTIYTTDSIQIGLQSSVVGGGILLGQALGGTAITYVPKVKIQVIVASCLAMAFLTPLATLNVDTHAMTIALGTLGLIAIGYVDNISFPGVTLVTQPSDIGLATGALGSLRALGGAVAEALYSSVLNNKLTENLPAYVTPAAENAGLPASSLPALFAGITSGSFADVPGINATIEAAVGSAVKEAYVQSFRIVFFCTIPFSVLLIAGACLVPNMESYLHNNVAKKLQPGSGGGAVKGQARVQGQTPVQGQGEIKNQGEVQEAARAESIHVESKDIV